MWNLRQESNASRPLHGIEHADAHLHRPSGTLATATQQQVRELPHDGSIQEMSPGHAQPTSKSFPLAPVPYHNSLAPMGTSFIWAAMMIYLFLAQLSSHKGSATPYTQSSLTLQWTNPQVSQGQVVKSRKLCSRWTTAIIQQLWDTAWDLLTHHNVESHTSGFGQPIIRRTTNPYSFLAPELSSCYRPMYSLSLDSFPSYAFQQVTPEF